MFQYNKFSSVCLFLEVFTKTTIEMEQNNQFLCYSFLHESMLLKAFLKYGLNIV